MKLNRRNLFAPLLLLFLALAAFGQTPINDLAVRIADNRYGWASGSSILFQSPRSDIATLQSAATATGNGTAFDVGAYGGIAVQISGTFSATVTFEATIDRTNWIAIKADNLNDRTSATTATAAGIFQIPLSGAVQFRARISAYTSGSVTVKARGVAGQISLKQSSGGGGGSGTVTSVGFTGGLISVGDPTGAAALTVAGTSGGVPYFDSTSTWNTSALLAANSLMKGGGAGAAPSTITTGTGVLAALGVNTGSAGAFVVNGGALGTPSSGTLTSATGLPVSTGISGLGTGIATALAINTGSAGAPVLFNGALGTPSSGTATNITGLPVSTGISGLGTGIATALAVNIGSAGAPTLFNGAGGTPSSLTLTNATGLPPTTGISGWPANASGVLTNNGSGTLSWAAAGSGITIDSTAITSGTAQRVLFESATNKVSEAAGFTFDGTSALTLGVAGTSVGSVAFKNATSGTITVQPVTGALGTVTLSLPATTSTLAGLAIAQTFTANQAITATVTTGTGTSSGFSVAADSLTTGTGANFASSSVTSGSVVNIASTSTAAASSTLKGLNIAISGANGTTAQTVTGAAISVTNTNATSGTNVALTLTASGATTANTALSVTAGRVLIPDGTAALPAYSFTSAFTSGLYIDGGGLLNFSQGGTSRFQITTQPSIRLAAATRLEWNSTTLGGGGPDLILTRAAAANLAFGAADAASPVAQTLSVQNVVAGTSNTAGADWTFKGSAGTGTGAGGGILFSTAPAGSTGTTQNSFAEAFRVNNYGGGRPKSVTFANLPGSPTNGDFIYCSDCAPTSAFVDQTCASGGSGSMAFRVNGAWKCYN